MFIVLLSFSESLATKYVSLNDEPCMIRPTFIDLNLVELKYYPFMISLDKCNGSCNVLSSKKTRQCECKNYCICKEDYSWNPSTCIWENSKYLKSIANTSVIVCHKVTSTMDIILTKMANTVAANVTKNYYSKKVRYKFDCYILHALSSVIILLLIITIIFYHYAKHRSRQKDINTRKI